MHHAMVVIVPQQCGPAGIMHVPVSVPRIACLIDHVKYLEPSDAATVTAGRRCAAWLNGLWHVTAPSNSASNCAARQIAGAGLKSGDPSLHVDAAAEHYLFEADISFSLNNRH